MITMSDLLPGDILLFTSDGGSLDRIICALTDSTVTHAAIYYRTGVLMDAGGGGVDAHAVREASADEPDARQIYVRRMNPPMATMGPVIDAAFSYVNEPDQEHDGYDWAGLTLTAFILLYRKETHPGPVQEALTGIFRRIEMSLDPLLHELVPASGSGPHPMFCSEYVFQCFLDAPPAYHLQLKGGNILQAAPARAPLLDRMEAWLEGTPAAAPAPLLAASAALDFPTLVQRLEAALAAPEDGAELSSELVLAARKLGDALGRLRGPDAASGLGFLRAQQALFVTPGDLLCACVNLADAGSLEVLRTSAPLSLL